MFSCSWGMKQAPSRCKETHVNLRKNTTATLNDSTHLWQSCDNLWQQRLGKTGHNIIPSLMAFKGQTKRNLGKLISHKTAKIFNMLYLINNTCASHNIFAHRKQDWNIAFKILQMGVSRMHHTCGGLRDTKEIFELGVAAKQEELHGCVARTSYSVFLLAPCFRCLPCFDVITYRRIIRSYMLQIWKVRFILDLWRYLSQKVQVYWMNSCILKIFGTRLGLRFNSVGWPHIINNLNS